MKFKPLPKWAGYLSVIVAVCAPIAAAQDIVGVKVAFFASIVSAGVAALSHSITGDGGLPPKE